VAFNYCLLLLSMNKVELCREHAYALKAQYPDSAVPVLLLASLLYRTKKISTCEEFLQEEIARLEGREKARAQASLAQLYLSQHDTQKTIEVLRSIKALCHRPAILSTLVSLFESLSEVRSAVDFLDQADRTLEGGDGDVSQHKAILKASAAVKLKHGLYREAADIFRRLLKLDRGDIEALSHLVVACAEFDPVEAESYVARMPSAKSEGALDGEALESATIPALHRKDNVETSESPSQEDKKTNTGPEAEEEKEKEKEGPLPKELRPICECSARS